MTTYKTYDNTVPEGTYAASLSAIETVEGQWGERLQWKFCVSNGPFSGAITSAFSGSDRPTLKSNLGRYLAMLEGDEPRAGISRDPDAYIGRPYTVTVTASDSGGTKVTSFRPRDTASSPTESTAADPAAAKDGAVPF